MSPGASAVPVQVLVGSAQRTLLSGGARVVMTGTQVTTAAGQSRTVETSGQGVLDPRQRLGDIFESFPGGLSAEFLEVGTVGYFRFSAPLASRIPTPWISLDFGPLLQSVAGLGGSPSGNDPLGSLELLTRSGIAAGVTDLGSERIRGVETTHYRVVLNPSRLQEIVASNPLAAGLPLGAIRVSSAVDNVWIDGAGLVRRASSSVLISEPGPGTAPVTNQTEFSEDLFDYGTPVSVTAPPPSEVTRVTSILGLIRLLTGAAAPTGA